MREKKCAVNAALQSNGRQLTPETRESDTSSMAGGLSGARDRRFTLDPLRDWRVSWRPPGPNAGVFPFEGEHTPLHWQLTPSSGWLVQSYLPAISLKQGKAASCGLQRKVNILCESRSVSATRLVQDQLDAPWGMLCVESAPSRSSRGKKSNVPTQFSNSNPRNKHSKAWKLHRRSTSIRSIVCPVSPPFASPSF